MKSITRLAISNLKKNKSRSVLILLSILLTTTLLAVITTFGYGLVKSNRANAGVLYGNYYGSFGKVTTQQLETINRRSEFVDVGTLAMVGVVEGEKEKSLYYMDENALSMLNKKNALKTGSFPEKEKDIVATEGFFKAQGIRNPKVGDQITLSYRKDQKTPFKQEAFRISGIMEQNQEAEIGDAFVSDVYYKKIYAESDRSYVVYFSLDSSVPINTDNGEEVIKELAVKCGVSEKYASENYPFLMWTMDPGVETIVVCAMLALVVIIFSILVIYNIFQVGIVQKVQEYGKVKALGATRKQMKKLVMTEGVVLAAFSIPAGLIVGYVIATMSFSWIMETAGSGTNAKDMISVSIFSPLMLVLTAVASLAAVRLALRRPMKIVARISPVEAMRYQDRTSGRGKQRGMRKGQKSLNVWKMTMANLSGNRKRTISTIVTMGLSCVLFVVLANFVGNMDAVYGTRQEVEYGQFKISLDYSLHDEVYPENNLDAILQNNPLNDTLLQQIEEIDGVTEVKTDTILMTQVEKNSESSIQTIKVLDKETFETEMDTGGSIGTVSYEQAGRENALIWGWSNFMELRGVKIGQTRNFELSNGSEKYLFEGNVLGSFGNCDADWAITQDTYEKMGFSNASVHNVWVDCKKKDVSLVRDALSQTLDGIGHIEWITYDDTLKMYEASTYIMKVGGMSFALLIAVISFMNMANTIITSAITRKQEFGVLQAIGMTNRQLKFSLQLEGILFTTGTVIVSLLAGLPLGYAAFRYGKDHSWIGLYEYHFPVAAIGLMILFLAVFQIILSWLLTRNLKKESLIERIRYQG